MCCTDCGVFLPAKNISVKANVRLWTSVTICLMISKLKKNVCQFENRSGVSPSVGLVGEFQLAV